MSKRGLKRHHDRDQLSWAEKAFMAVSVLVTLALFSYLGYQAVTAPEVAMPTARIEQVEPQEDGSYVVTVRLENVGGKGLRSAVVDVNCGDPPPSITLDNIPAESHRIAKLTCPPGEPPTEASVSAWFSA